MLTGLLHQSFLKRDSFSLNCILYTMMVGKSTLSEHMYTHVCIRTEIFDIFGMFLGD